MKLSRWVFLLAVAYGLIALLPPLCVTPEQFGQSAPPSLLLFYYGFFGIALSWQVVLVLIWMDPLRYRPMMLLAALPKLSFFIVCMGLFTTGHLRPGRAFYLSLGDAAFAILFAVCFVRLSSAAVAWQQGQAPEGIHSFGFPNPFSRSQ